MAYHSEPSDTSSVVPKKTMRVSKKRKQENGGNNLDNSNFQLLAGDNSNFQLLAGDAVVPVALISNISSSIASGNVPTSHEAGTMSAPQTFTLSQPITNVSGQLSSASNAVSAFATSFPLQGATLPMVAITDMHFQTVPSTSGDGVAPLILAMMPSAVGDGQLVQQGVESSESQRTAISGGQNQVVPDSNQT